MAGTAYYTCDNANESLESVVRRMLRFVDGNPFINVPLVGIPFISDLVFDFDTRTDLNLVDNIAGELAPIQDFVVGNFSGAEWVDYTLGGDYNNTDFCFGTFFTIDTLNITQRIIQKRGTGAVTGWFLAVSAANFIEANARSGANTATATGAVALNTNDSYFAYGCFNNTTGRLDVFIYNITTGVLVDSANNTVAGLIGQDFTTARRMSIGSAWNGVGIGNQLQLFEGNVWGGWCVNSMLTGAEVTSLSTGTIPTSLKTSIASNASNKICLDVYSGIDSSGNDFHGNVNGVDKGYSTFQRELFDNGFQQYWDVATGLVSLQIPYHTDGTPTAPGTPFVHDGTNYALSEAHLYNAFHNLAESFVSFNPTGSLLAKFDIFDRRAVTATHNAASRASIYYDGTSRTTASIYHISELSQFVEGQYLVVGDRRKLYIQGTVASIGPIDRDNLDRIFVYATDKTGALDISVLTFTNDVTHVLLDGAGNYVFDINNYAVLVL